MTPIGIVYYVCWVLFSFFGWRRNWPNTTWPNAGGDLLLVIMLLIVGLVLFPPRL